MPLLWETFLLLKEEFVIISVIVKSSSRVFAFNSVRVQKKKQDRWWWNYTSIRHFSRLRNRVNRAVPFFRNISHERFLVSGHPQSRCTSYFSSYPEERIRCKKQDTSFSVKRLSETNYHNHRADKCINHVYPV